MRSVISGLPQNAGFVLALVAVRYAWKIGRNHITAERTVGRVESREYRIPDFSSCRVCVAVLKNKVVEEAFFSQVNCLTVCSFISFTCLLNCLFVFGL